MIFPSLDLFVLCGLCDKAYHMSHSQSRMLQTKLINIVWQTILLRDLDILRCSKGNVSLHWPIVGTQCYYFLVQMMSSPKYISSSRRNGVGTDRVAGPAAAPRPLSAHGNPAPVTTLLIRQYPCTQTPLHQSGALLYWGS